MTEDLLDVTDLRLEGPEGVILDGISLRVAPGQIVGVQGPSGAGKSMLAASIAGLLPHGIRQSGGQIRLSGRTVGWAMQDAADALDPLRRIGAELRTTLAVHRRPADPARWIAAIGLTPAQAARVPAGLSGGQRQRAVLALAMCGEPALLLADEPTASLDPASRDRVGALLRRAARRDGNGVLVISHDAAFLAAIADCVVTLPQGAAPVAAVATRLDRSSGDGTEPEAVLRLQDVSFSHGRTTTLAQVSLTVPRGRTLALMGPSGSGKTTLARLAAGLLLPASGTVTRRGPVAMVFQDAYGSLDPFWSVGRSIAEPLSPTLSAASRAAEVARLLRAVGLAPEAARFRPVRFSGGQRQRIAIARALAARPALLVCDEPTSALDPRTRLAILDLLRVAQARDGFAMLLVSHDPDTVEGLAHVVRHLCHGRLLPPGATSHAS